ncbi:MAG: hypothetical protein QXT25_01365 [Candidatus Anstonellaceae archaeon]
MKYVTLASALIMLSFLTCAFSLEAWVADEDIFYSYQEGNNIINILANVSDNSSPVDVLINFTNINESACNGNPVFYMQYNQSSGLFHAECIVSDIASSKFFEPATIFIFANDSFNQINTTAILVVLYNFTSPSSTSDCFIFDNGTTDFSKEPNLEKVNLSVVISLNGSKDCTGADDDLWEGFRKVANLSFTNINATNGTKLALLSSAFNISIALPNTYNQSRIFVNTSVFEELDTNANINLYNLPFESQPEIIADNSSKNISNITWISTFDSDKNVSFGNLSFSVTGFSGYNISDVSAPEISIHSPTQSSSVDTQFVINVSINGTGTAISSLNISILNSSNDTVQYYYYNPTNNTANCTQISYELLHCVLGTYITLEGNYSLFVEARDYGYPSGNANNSYVEFSVVNTPPQITIFHPLQNSTITSNSTDLNFSVIDSNLSTCWYVLNDNIFNLSGCQNTSLLLNSTFNILTVFANDSANKTGNSTIYFLYDPSNSSFFLNHSTLANNSSTSFFIHNSSPPAHIQILNISLQNISLNLSTVSSLNGSTKSAFISNPINISLNISNNTSIKIFLPPNLSINGSSSWPAVLFLPTIKQNAVASPPDSGTNNIIYVVEVGFGEEMLFFDKAVRILIPAAAGRLAGYVHNGTFFKITSNCSQDNQQWADANLNSTQKECKIDVGSDLVIWTKHFTQFVAYSNTPPSSSGGGSGSSGSSSSTSSGGGGGGEGGGVAGPASSRLTSSHFVDIGIANCTIQISREISSSNTSSVVSTVLKNTGDEICDLKDFVFADTIPDNFAAINEISFTPQYSSREGWKVIFTFPSFSPGESKAIAYKVNGWVPPSRLQNFTTVEVYAKKVVASPQPQEQPQQPQPQPQPPQPQPTQPPAQKETGDEKAQQPSAPPIPQPQSQEPDIVPIALAAFIVFAGIAVAVAVIYFTVKRKMRP